MTMREPDVRLYREVASAVGRVVGDYVLECDRCGAELWRYAYAMEHRHLVAAVKAADAHVCGVAA